MTSEGSEFWKNRKVLLAPAHSELATWVLLLLHQYQAQITLAGEFINHANLFDFVNGAEKGNLQLGLFTDSSYWKNVIEASGADVVIYLPEFANKNLSLSEQVVDLTQESLALLQAFQSSQAKALIWKSSDRVYEKSFEDKVLDEASPLGPSESSSALPILAETLLKAFQQEYFNPSKYNKHQKSASILRMCTGIGPTLQQDSLLFQAAESFKNGRHFEVKKPQSVRPWVHNLDLAKGVLLAAEYTSKRGPKAAKVLNLGAEEYESVGQVVEEFSELWGVGSKQLLHYPSKMGGVSVHRKMSSELAGKELLWSPQMSLSDSLKATAMWYNRYFSGQDTVEILKDLVNKY